MTIDAGIIDHVTHAIAERFRPERIVLFGSQARGDAGPDSDLDLCVVMDTTAAPLQRIIEVSSIFHLPRWPMDILVYTPEEYEQRRWQKGTLVSTIETEGKVLYDART